MAEPGGYIAQDVEGRQAYIGSTRVEVMMVSGIPVVAPLSPETMEHLETYLPVLIREGYHIVVIEPRNK